MIRPASRADLTEIAAIEAESFSEPWSLALLEDSFENPLDFFWVVTDEADGGICGYMNVRVIAGEGELMRIAVRPGFRRRGYAKKLMDALARFSMEETLSAVTLEVRAGNAAAISLYKSYGFKAEAIRKAYYRSPVEDAVIMWNRSI